MVISLSAKKDFIPVPVEPHIWRALLWHTGADLPGHHSYTREPVTVIGVAVRGITGTGLDNLEQLRVTGVTTFCNWVQIDNYLYVRFRVKNEYEAYASAQDWMVTLKTLEAAYSVSDKAFEVINGQAYYYGMIGKYQIKISAEPHDYQTLKFNSLKLSLLRKALKEDPSAYLGSTLVVKDDDLFEIEKQYVENIVYGFDLVTVECKDLREKLSDNVIDQQFNREEYRNSNNNVIMDEDTGKRYKADAAGYCNGVPCDCLNGYAFDTQNYRRYRAAYGDIDVDYDPPDTGAGVSGRGVEVEMENSWKVLPRSDTWNAPNTADRFQEGHWWPETVEETLPSGLPVTTTVICVPNLVAHPPEPGITVPDLEATPRKLRVTGTFHSERPDITDCYNIFLYLIERYSSIPWTSGNFNQAEIQAELGLFSGRPMGVFIDKPAKLYNVIGLLQTGQIYGWQFCQYRGKLTARVFNPDRPLFGLPVRTQDIMNLKELKIDLDGKNYVSTMVIQFNRLYSEDTAAEYFDEAKEDEVILLRGVSKRKEIPTLLKNKDDAMLRYNEEIRDCVNISRSIKGIKLSGKKWYGLRQYDFLPLEAVNPKTGQTLFSGTVSVTQILVDIKTETVTVDVKEKV
jgi:hypothetical protein